MAVESEISTNIRAALAQHLKRDAAQVRLDDELRKDLGLDSLSMIELLFRIEEAFDIEIPNEDLGDIRTVGEVIAYVERRVANKGAAPTPRLAPAAGTPRPAVPAAAPRPAATASATPRPAAPATSPAPRPAPAAVAAPVRAAVGAAPKRSAAASKDGRGKPAAARTATAKSNPGAKAAAKKKGSRRS